MRRREVVKDTLTNHSHHGKGGRKGREERGI